MKPSHPELTFRQNRLHGRHGWVRLTPAYSIQIVQDILKHHPSIQCVLDPFSGTGTTGLVCSEQGIDCDLLDINPFLIWLAETKVARYTEIELSVLRQVATQVIETARVLDDAGLWVPSLHNIERWWSGPRLNQLSRFHYAIHQNTASGSPIQNLLWIAFCRTLIHWSNAAFNHQSMSFKENSSQLPLMPDENTEIENFFLHEVRHIIEGSRQSLTGHVRIHLMDSRKIQPPDDRRYDCVITSPPYPNRMSYIRELRPYMYWLQYLDEPREAGELDWKAIGGTWGIATSRLQDWQPAADYNVPALTPLLDAIRGQSVVLANYIHRYFIDMDAHLGSLSNALESGGKLYYIVGNSRFYDTVIPVEHLYAHLMQKHEFIRIQVQPIRKRSSKKELFEYIVSAEKP
jgi:hypothetical protein